MKTLFLLGWHGTANIGDDLMAILFLKNAKKDYSKIFSFKRFYPIKDNINLTKMESIKNMIVSDDLVISGGNIFLISSKKSYFKLLLFFIIFYLRRILKKTTKIDSIGLDLNVGKFNRFLLIKILSQVDYICIREPLSFRYLKYIKSLCILRYDISLDFDRVYRFKKELYETYNTKKKNDTLVWFISGQPAKKDKNTFFKTKNILEEFKKNKELRNLKINFFCQNNIDIERVNNILKEFPFIVEYNIVVYDYLKIEKQMKLIASSEYSIVERYHGAILSEIFRLKWYKLSFSEKLSRAYLPNNFCINCEN